ncbi:MAG: hypothetical protein ACRD2C_26365 [Acidimicrobiales bacterium]
MTRQPKADGRRRGIVAAVVALVIGSLAVVAGRAVPATADPPPTSAGNVFHGFVLDDDGDFTTIDHPDAGTTVGPDSLGTGTQISGINDRGELLGLYADRSEVIREFVRNRRGRYTTIDPPGSFANEETVDINNRGEMVGFSDADGENTAGTQGFLRTRRGRYETIEVPGATSTAALKLNDRGQVAGIYFDQDTTAHGFVWDDGEVTTIDHPRAEIGTFIFGINDRRDTVGFYLTADGSYHGFLRDRRGRFTNIEAPGAELGTAVLSINDRDEMVGATYNADGSTDAFFRSRRGRFTIIEAPGEATYTRALDINDHGDIVGDYDTEPPGTNDPATSPQPSQPSPPAGPARPTATTAPPNQPTSEMAPMGPGPAMPTTSPSPDDPSDSHPPTADRQHRHRSSRCGLGASRTTGTVRSCC